MPNPEPASVVQGRPMLYDATHNSGNGEAACASCHIFGDLDDLAWDLGNPDDAVKNNPITINLGAQLIINLNPFGFRGQFNGTGKVGVFHPMKGPMTTQTLRGLVNSGAMHWRGDRAVGQTGTSATNATVNFNNFIVAFPALVGAAQQPSTADMQRFTNFQLQVTEPPNPVRALDNSLNSAQTAGKNFFQGNRPADGVNLGFSIPGVQTSFSCNGCHELDPAEGEFGTSKNSSFEGIISQTFKIPHLRNMYTKVGMFGVAKVPVFDAADTGQLGDQIRGFGFTNEGASPTIFHFVTAAVFHPQILSGFPLINPNATRRNVEQFLLAFDSDLAPITGQQVTLTSSNSSAVGARITLMEQRANASFTSKVLGGTVKEVELVARVVQNGTAKGFLFNPGNSTFVPSGGGTALTDAQIRALASTAGQEVTFTAVPTGSGARLAAVH
jgi:hypothetical protein